MCCRRCKRPWPIQSRPDKLIPRGVMMMARHQLKPTSLTTQRLRDSHLSQCATRYMYPILLDPKTKTVIVIVTELGHHQNFFPFSWLPSLSLSASFVETSCNNDSCVEKFQKCDTHKKIINDILTAKHFADCIGKKNFWYYGVDSMALCVYTSLII